MWLVVILIEMRPATTELSENKDEDGYLLINAHSVEGEDCKVSGDVVNSNIDSSGAIINPNPSYEVVSGGVNLEDNPSYKMKHT